MPLHPHITHCGKLAWLKRGMKHAFFVATTHGSFHRDRFSMCSMLFTALVWKLHIQYTVSYLAPICCCLLLLLICCCLLNLHVHHQALAIWASARHTYLARDHNDSPIRAFHQASSLGPDTTPYTHRQLSHVHAHGHHIASGQWGWRRPK